MSSKAPFPPAKGPPGTPSSTTPGARSPLSAPDAPPPPKAGQAGGSAASSFVEAAPDYAENPPPRYPRIALLQGWSGEVWVRVRVSPAGRVLEVRIERSSGHKILDSAALDAIRRWRFHPARRGGVPVEGEVRLPIRFKLRSS